MHLDEGMDVRRLPLARVAARCREETEKYRRREPHSTAFCYELFRRAMAEGDQDAWARLLEQYTSQVTRWVLRQPARPLVGEDDDYWVNDAFRRFWQATHAKQFENFPTLPSLLKFLQTCVFAAIADAARRQPPQPPAPWGELTENEQERSNFVDQPGVNPTEFWEIVQTALPDATERRVIYLQFAWGLPPREIQRRDPEQFPTVNDVYRACRNALERLRRHPELRDYFN